MTTIVRFEAPLLDQVIAAWRTLHPEWTWFDDEGVRESLLKYADDPFAFVILDDDAVVGTMIANPFDETAAQKNRFISIDARPEHIDGAALTELLEKIATADRELQTDLWQVLNVGPDLLALSPLFESAGFILHDRSLRMEWAHEKVILEPPPPGTEMTLYTGGNPDFDQAIVDLHNRAYRPSRLTPGATLEHLWTPWPTLTAREYVLGWIDGQLGGYAEWMVSAGKAVMNSLAVSRAYWGTSLAPAVGTKAMERMWEAGHHTFQSGVSSRNAASIKLQERFGWRITAEESRRYVRKF